MTWHAHSEVRDGLELDALAAKQRLKVGKDRRLVTNRSPSISSSPITAAPESASTSRTERGRETGVLVTLMSDGAVVDADGAAAT
jgi:hypothetical protein